MKRLLLILTILANCFATFAQYDISDSHKQKLVESINSRKYDKAAEEVAHVTDWSFDKDNKELYVDISSGMNFLKYADSININTPATDSLALYITKVCDVYVYYYYDEGDYAHAIEFQKTATEIYKSVLGENHLSYATALNGLGLLYMGMGDYAKTEQYYLESLRIHKSVFGENHPGYATSLNNLGLLYKDMGEYDKAEPYFLDALKILKSIRGENHPDYATLLNNLGVVYYSIGDYTKAEQYFLEVLRIQESVLGESHPSYALSLNNLGALYSYKGDYVKAEQYYLEALKIRKSVLGEKHLDYAQSLNNLGELYHKMSDYAKAEQYYLEALKIRKSVLGENHPDYAISLNNLGALYYNTGNFSLAEQYYFNTLKIQASIFGENHPDYARSLDNLGVLYQEMGSYTHAEQYFTQALKIRKSIFGENHPSYALSQNNLGELYRAMGDYAHAEQYYLEALEIQKSVLGENHPDYAMSLCNLGSLYQDMGNYTLAEQYFTHALKIQESVLGENHPNYTRSLHNLGGLYQDMGDYVKAEQYYIKASKTFKSVLGESHPNYTISLNNLGMLYNAMGDYDKAEQYFMQALKIQKSVLGENHPSYATSLNNLGSLYHDVGDYDKAEQYFMQALKIQKSVLGENHPDYAISLDNFGLLYKDMGDYSKTIKYLSEALKIRKSVLGKNHPDYALSLNNLGSLYHDVGDYDKAEQYFTQALKIQKSVLGENHPEYATSLDNLGLLYKDKGNYDKAEPYYLDALKIRKSVLGENHPDYAGLLNNLGELYWKEGDYIKAEQCYLEALKIKKSVLRGDHPHYAISLNNLGVLYEDMSNYAKAELYYTQAMQIYRNRFLQSTGFMTEQQRNKYWETMRWMFTVTYPLFFRAYYPKKASAAAIAYDNELFVKGLLLNSSEAVKLSVQESGDTALVRRWNELTAEKGIIMTLQEKESASDQISIHEQRAEQLEKEITLSSSAYREEQKQWRITWDSVRSHLAPNQVAIEYMVAPLTEDSTMYYALLLRDTCSYPLMIQLFNEPNVTTLVNTATESQTGRTYSVSGNGTRISEYVWSSILPYIKQGETIYFAPSGILLQLAIEALPYDSTHIMADMFNLVRLSSTREIVTHKDELRHTTATLYGGIQYDMETKELIAESEAYKTYNLLASRRIESDTLNRGTVDYLPWTKTEVEKINSMLRKNNLQVQLFTAKSANEESFKALSGKHQNLLHIATHGFFWADSTARKKDYFSQHKMMRMGDNMPTPPTIDPLNRCGLLFAGANTALQGHSNEIPKGVQDGILTAKEISLLDLRDADLVVLSACETGKGEITGDGVFGLQRAFKQAGAQTIIMSLWPVNDAATQLLMTEFYRNWLGTSDGNGGKTGTSAAGKSKMSKREAFRQAQTTVRSQYPEPVYWAGFIMLD